MSLLNIIFYLSLNKVLLTKLHMLKHELVPVPLQWQLVLMKKKDS